MRCCQASALMRARAFLHSGLCLDTSLALGGVQPPSLFGTTSPSPFTPLWCPTNTTIARGIQRS